MKSAVGSTALFFMPTVRRASTVRHVLETVGDERRDRRDVFRAVADRVKHLRGGCLPAVEQAGPVGQAACVGCAFQDVGVVLRHQLGIAGHAAVQPGVFGTADEAGGDVDDVRAIVEAVHPVPEADQVGRAVERGLVQAIDGAAIVESADVDGDVLVDEGQSLDVDQGIAAGGAGDRERAVAGTQRVAGGGAAIDGGVDAAIAVEEVIAGAADDRVGAREHIGVGQLRIEFVARELRNPGGVELRIRDPVDFDVVLEIGRAGDGAGHPVDAEIREGAAEGLLAARTLDRDAILDRLGDGPLPVLGSTEVECSIQLDSGHARSFRWITDRRPNVPLPRRWRRCCCRNAGWRSRFYPAPGKWHTPCGRPRSS